MTEKQKKFLEFVKYFRETRGFPPTIREIAKGIGVSSTSTVKAMMDRLIDKGILRKDASKARSLEIIDKRSFDVPLIGRIKAGYPVLSEENIESYLSINLTGKKYSDCFFLRVDGDSMKNKGILDGDIVLIKQVSELSNKDIGAFRVNGETTLKTFVRKDNEIILKPENESFEDIVVTASDDFEIIGKMVFLIRDLENTFDIGY